MGQLQKRKNQQNQESQEDSPFPQVTTRLQGTYRTV